MPRHLVALLVFVSVSVSVVACSCGGGGRAGANPCDALVVAADTARALRDASQVQFDAADVAMGLWARWEARTVSAEEDGTGLFSGAGQRATAYWRAGHALCEASRLARHPMRHISRPIDDDEVQRRAHQLEDFRCEGPLIVVPPEPTKRAEVIAKYAARGAQAREVEDAMIAACYRKLGGQRQETRLPPIALPAE